MSPTNDDIVWGVDETYKVFKWNKSKTKWERISRKMTMVSAGGSGVWGISPDGKVWYRKGTYGGMDRLFFLPTIYIFDI